jgi:acetyl esterase/lipase
MRVEPVEADGLHLEWLIPESVDSERVMLFLHGGGWCSGSVDSHRAFAGRLAKNLRMRALHLTYRLAPEDPFPAGLEDCVAAYRWLRASGVSAANLVIAGNSAGGGLAVSTVLVLRDAGEAVPHSVVCFSPTVDLALTGSSIRRNGQHDLLTPAFLQAVSRWYMAGQDPYSPLISPLHADLHGLPPMLVMAGDHELLLDDAVGLASRARKAGVDVTLRIWPGLIHTFEQMTLLPECQEAVAQVETFLNRGDRPHSPVQLGEIG